MLFKCLYFNFKFYRRELISFAVFYAWPYMLINYKKCEKKPISVNFIPKYGKNTEPGINEKS